MKITNVGVIVLSTKLNSDAFAKALTSMALQVIAENFNADFAPIYGLPAISITEYATPQDALKAPAGTAFLLIEDQLVYPANLAAEHLFTQTGLPHGAVGIENLAAAVTATAPNGIPWTVGFDHELKEMLVDPNIQECQFVQSSATAGKLYSKEVCDPVQYSWYSGALPEVAHSDLVQLANFVLPAYWDQANPIDTSPVGPWDKLGILTGPLPALATGGYLGVWDTEANPEGWSIINGGLSPNPMAARRPGSRLSRRFLTR